MTLPPEIRYETDGPILTVTIDRPDAHNALTMEMNDGLIDAFNVFDADDDLLVAILTGTGRSFCAGADLGSLIPKVTAGEFESWPDPASRYFSGVSKPIIAAVNGTCIAGGTEILLGTDLRVASTNATFGLGEVKWGLVPAAGSHVRLPRQAPWPIAMELLLTGKPLGAERMREVGLLNAVVEPEELMPAARKYAETICRNGPLAVRTSKAIARRALQLETAYVIEHYMAAKVFASADAKEGPKAFMEKRRPEFTGR
jgi:enoyl-CoA hydratase